jgi:predicted negative regulator of RcsB-dependent stress response
MLGHIIEFNPACLPSQKQCACWQAKTMKLKEFILTEYMTEQEQIEQLKAWVKQYGLTVIAGVAIALVLVSGWHYWQRYQDNILFHASGIYDEMLDARSQTGKPALENTAIQAQRLLSHYPKTPYAQLAALMLARDAVAKQDFAEATKQLTWVIDHSHNTSLKQIARIRMARIAITQKQPQAAIDMLNIINDKSFAGLIDEVKGDAYIAMQDTAKAKDAYLLALQELPKDEVTERPLLQMKIDNIATS